MDNTFFINWLNRFANETISDWNFMIIFEPFQLNIKSDNMVSKEANLRLGDSVFVAAYRDRMRRGLGINKSGQVARHKPLKKSTIRNRRGRALPLLRTGKMVRSFRVNRNRTTDQKIVLDFPSRERIKASVHQFGQRSKGIPARPHVGVSQKDLQEAVRVIESEWADQLDDFIQIENQ